MIKQIICLHISKLTLLGYVTESYSAHKGAGVDLQVGETCEYPDPAYYRLSPHSHYKLSPHSHYHHASPRHFSDPKMRLLQRYKSSSVKAPMECRGKGFWDGTGPVSGCLEEEPEVGKGKNQQLGEKQAWESHSYSDKMDTSSVTRLQVSMCVQLCPASPVRLSISFCNSILGLCWVPM